ncbi:hypothetical protein BRARA_I00445 [Brassica rapa]|uniref:Defensin-like domain-containing protein n=1 Tax=Brassica campestris TaxID=3711 RepID=A0A397XVY5_BRACM|nr:hypothetical protein BRARA_I00445 [Brassica rapa]
MGITKAPVQCLFVVILAVLLSNHNVLTSGAEIQKSSYDQCTSTLCSNSYTWFQCRRDCFAAGYTGRGDCASRSHNEPKRCCCRNK